MARILVVDDDRDIAQMFAVFLEMDGHDVTTASSGEAAWEHYQTAKKMGEAFDLIISDLAMPFINGYEVAQRIRDAGDDETRIVFVTAHPQGFEQRTQEFGLSGLWMKPISAEELQSGVRSCLER